MRSIAQFSIIFEHKKSGACWPNQTNFNGDSEPDSHITV